MSAHAGGAELLAAAAGLKPWLSGIRRHLHRCPELGLEERDTATAIEGWLQELGVETHRQGTAVVGLLRGAGPGRTVALRADMDALPIQEEGTHEYRSQRAGCMHACGHDAHMAIQLGAARLLLEQRAPFLGHVKLLFQPAEESVGGARTMVAEGCLEDPHVDRIYGLHVMPYLPVGSVELKRGVLMGSSTSLHLRISGRSAHGAYPETGIDAVLIAAHVVLALHGLVSRAVSPLEEVVLSLGTIQGGTAANILADRVELRATLRTTSRSVREAFLERIRAAVEGIPAALGGSGSMEVRPGYEAVVNHEAAMDEVEGVARDLLGAGRIQWKAKPSLGVEDFSCFLQERVGAYYHLGCGNEAAGIAAPLHNARFDLDEDCLAIGAAMQAALALRFLGEGGEA